ncbi:MAG TPA: DUF3426 domain-containing protein [Stellaceae bacterium]
MIVTCPACSTRYLIDPRALGVTGRSVRCTQCSHVWMQLPAEDGPRRVDLPLPGAMPPPRALPPPSPPAEVFEVPPAADGVAARGIGRPLGVTLLIVLVLGVLYAARADIIDRVPALAPVYGALGLVSGDPRTDLELRGVTSDRQQRDGRATLVIQGEVANISANARRVPSLRITLEDAARHPIKSWTVTATQDRLQPGDAVPFHSSVADPGAATVGASVSFVGD